MTKLLALLILVLLLRWGFIRMDSRAGQWFTTFRERWQQERKGRDDD